MSPVSNFKNDILRDRAIMFRTVRSFFSARSVCEVDCPILSASASVDAHIDLIPASPVGGTHYLHSSPEYGMKRLLSRGMGDIYQLSHVFRNGECGIKHNPEFTMVEWYRVGISFTGLIQETLDFVRLFLGELPSSIISYREAFQRFAGIDYLAASTEELITYLDQRKIPIYPNAIHEGKDALLNLILGSIIEPRLGQDELCALAYYPLSQAALAQTCMHGNEAVSERFEIYFKGVELCNGYHELADPTEQRRRLEEANIERKKLGKEPLPIDENFLQSLEKGIPDCCGVAVGFDRLMMLRHNAQHISDVIPFSWSMA